MNKFIIGLILVWLAVLTAFGCYTIKAQQKFLKFADFVLDDNLKNVVQSGGATFYIVDMDTWATANLGTNVKLWRPVYVKDTDMAALIEWKRNQAVMLRDFANINWKSKMAASQADAYLKQHITDLHNRNRTPKEKAREINNKKKRTD